MAALAWAAGCVGDAPDADFNELALLLSPPPYEAVNVVQYEVSGGPNDIVRSGSLRFERGSALALRVGRLPLGSGYTVEVSTVTDSGRRCQVSAPFAVDDADVTRLELTLVCSEAPTVEVDNGEDVILTVNVDAGSS